MIYAAWTRRTPAGVLEERLAGVVGDLRFERRGGKGDWWADLGPVALVELSPNRLMWIREGAMLCVLECDEGGVATLGLYFDGKYVELGPVELDVWMDEPA